MRALALLVVSVITLAILQGGYHIVDAKLQHQLMVGIPTCHGLKHLSDYWYMEECIVGIPTCHWFICSIQPFWNDIHLDLLYLE